MWTSEIKRQGVEGRRGVEEFTTATARKKAKEITEEISSIFYSQKLAGAQAADSCAFWLRVAGRGSLIFKRPRRGCKINRSRWVANFNFQDSDQAMISP